MRFGGALVIRLPMVSKISLFAFVTLSLAVSGLHAAAADSMEQEYQQERKIALRDPKVRAAYLGE